MRTYGRVFHDDGTWTWVEVTTDANGFNDLVYLVTLQQTLLMIRGESPFYGNYGIPAFQSVGNGIPPDLYVSITQQQFAPYFGALTVAKLAAKPGQPPTYAIAATTHQGVKLSTEAPIPQ